MPTGIAVPMVAVNGRAAVVSGSDQVAKLIELAVSDGSSANPFNTDVGVVAPIFDLQGSGQRAILERAVRDRFAALEAGGRAELLSLQVTESPDTGETLVDVVYRDLETDERRTFTTRAGG